VIRAPRPRYVAHALLARRVPDGEVRAPGGAVRRRLVDDGEALVLHEPVRRRELEEEVAGAGLVPGAPQLLAHLREVLPGEGREPSRGEPALQDAGQLVRLVAEEALEQR